VRTGDRNRTISLAFQDLEPIAPIPLVPPVVLGPPRTSPAAWVFAGTGVAAAGVGTFFLVSAISERNRLRHDPCAVTKTCNIDSGQRKDDLATIAYGAAIVSGVVATYFFLTPTRARVTSFPAREVTVTPLFGGAAASWTEHF
jgi:hypothetical protein